MSLEKQITDDMKTAMKQKDKVALRGIRAIKSAILLLKTDGSGNEVTPDDEIKLLQKLVKQRKESYDIFVKQGREDLAAVEAEEIEIIERYLPEPLSDDQLRTMVQEIIDSLGASGMQDMGRVMGVASQKSAGRADGKTLANIVKELLNK